MNAYIAAFNKVELHGEDLNQFHIDNIILKNGENILSVKNYSLHENMIDIFLNGNINIKYECFIFYNNKKYKVLYNRLFKNDEFNRIFYYDGNLGAIYNKNFTTFKIWSPAAQYINLILYKNGNPEIKEIPEKFHLKENSGLWSITIDKDLDGYFYTYEISVYGSVNETIDPYAKAAGANGKRGAIVDLSKTSPYGWINDSIKNLSNYTDAVIYETSVRDISSHQNSGILNKRKFLGLSEENTHSDKDISTGLNHIKELGITHIQLMPVSDFITVNENNPVQYHWGYDPQNYNIPEGSYSTNPSDPKARIYELKKMIQSIHKNGIKVNMDVVYNHMWSKTESSFEKIFPGYYFRSFEDGTLSDGSGCGNDTASENPMMRKFIIDSVSYWVNEYHIDGFRFDLMGLHDVTTMNSICNHFKSLGKNIMIYGEGWDLNTSLLPEEKCTIDNSSKTPHIAYFNDVIRDAIKGNVFNISDKGFVSGKQNMESIIKVCVTGCTISTDGINAVFDTPEKSINYVSCHDDSTLFDKFSISNKNDSLDIKKSMIKLSCGIILTSQGIPFLHSGIEFCRTKYGVINSYESPDNINRLDWDRKLQFMDVFNYLKGFIALRKSHPAFRMESREKILQHLKFIENTPENTVAFILKDNTDNDAWKDIFVAYNANRYPVRINLPYAAWNINADEDSAGENTLKTISTDFIEINAISMKMGHI